MSLRVRCTVLNAEVHVLLDVFLVDPAAPCIVCSKGMVFTGAHHAQTMKQGMQKHWKRSYRFADDTIVPTTQNQHVRILIPVGTTLQSIEHHYAEAVATADKLSSSGE